MVIWLIKDKILYYPTELDLKNLKYLKWSYVILITFVKLFNIIVYFRLGAKTLPYYSLPNIRAKIISKLIGVKTLFPCYCLIRNRLSY
jgi:hypothetical protein